MWNISKYKYLPYCNKLLCICFKTNQLKWYNLIGTPMETLPDTGGHTLWRRETTLTLTSI